MASAATLDASSGDGAADVAWMEPGERCEWSRLPKPGSARRTASLGDSPPGGIRGRADGSVSALPWISLRLIQASGLIRCPARSLDGVERTVATTPASSPDFAGQTVVSQCNVRSVTGFASRRPVCRLPGSIQATVFAAVTADSGSAGRNGDRGQHPKTPVVVADLRMTPAAAVRARVV